jgi:hypothetical protein
MPISARVLCDSISPQGQRLTTMEWTFPRVILAEVNTHRMLSRNAASSRAIPTEKLIQRVVDDPFVPEFRQNQKGMQAGDVLDDDQAELARTLWLEGRDDAVNKARLMHTLNIHKQYVNRLLEPWMFCTIIVSATDWANVWHLRCSPEAEPSFQAVATMAREAMEASQPKEVPAGWWHWPLIEDQDIQDVQAYLDSSAYHGGEGISCSHMEMVLPEYVTKVSVGRCARVSYLTHEGKRDVLADIELHDRLAKSGHWSPFEHVATPDTEREYWGNFAGWRQYRKDFANENVVVAR